MTLTFPTINAARSIVWLVAGERKAPALGRLLEGKSADPAARVSAAQAIVVADRAATRLCLPA
jgi:6-phosphogluconolactonase/glucosamine-6-phosphate isomerase/deaminase